MAIVLLILYIIIAVILLVYFVKCIKGKCKWTKLFIFEIISIIIAGIFLIYYNNLPGYGFMPGLSYLGEVLFSFGAAILYGILFAITLILKIINYLLKKKNQGKNYFPMIFWVVAIVLLLHGAYTLFLDIKNDIQIEETMAQIIGYETNKYNSECPVVVYSVDNVKYKALVEVKTEQIRNSKLYDWIKITYNKYNPAELDYLAYYENVYVPCLVLSVIIVIWLLVYKKKNK